MKEPSVPCAMAVPWPSGGHPLGAKLTPVDPEPRLLGHDVTSDRSREEGLPPFSQHRDHIDLSQLFILREGASVYNMASGMEVTFVEAVSAELWEEGQKPRAPFF